MKKVTKFLSLFKFHFSINVSTNLPDGSQVSPSGLFQLKMNNKELTMEN